MSNLSSFYKDLLRWEGQQYRQLVHEWPQNLRDTIVLAFVNAVSDSTIKGSVCPIKPDSTNQSIGNQVEKYTVARLNTSLVDFSIISCSGRVIQTKCFLKKIRVYYFLLKLKLQVIGIQKMQIAES